MKKYFLSRPYFAWIFVYIFIFISCLYMPKDPDLGWHLKYGEYFFQHGQILRDNLFSTEMPDYKYVNSAWGTDLITYLFYSWASFWGVATLSAILLTLTFYFFSKAANLNFFAQTLIFPIILLFEAPLFRGSFRGQMFSLLGIGILYYLLSKGKKHLWLIPVLFLIWTNLHGEFILGLCLFLAWIIFKLTDHFSMIELKYLGIIFLASILATFINPFGADIYFETIKHAYNTSQKYIVEWGIIPAHSIFWWYVFIWLFLIGISSLIIIYQKKLSQYLFYIFTSFLLLLISFKVKRYVWVDFLISIPLIKILTDTIQRNLFVKKTLLIVFLAAEVAFLIFIKIPSLKNTQMNWETYCFFNICSESSAKFLENYSEKYTLFSEYDLGGWLIWNHPKIKPLIDGRMVFWKDESGYSAFEKYIQIENNQVDIDQTKYDLVYISPTKPVFYRLLKLVDEGKWEIIYQDPQAFVFHRKIKSPAN